MTPAKSAQPNFWQGMCAHWTPHQWVLIYFRPVLSTNYPLVHLGTPGFDISCAINKKLQRVARLVLCISLLEIWAPVMNRGGVCREVGQLGARAAPNGLVILGTPANLPPSDSREHLLPARGAHVGHMSAIVAAVDAEFCPARRPALATYSLQEPQESSWILSLTVFLLLITMGVFKCQPAVHVRLSSVFAPQLRDVTHLCKGIVFVGFLNLFDCPKSVRF